MRRTVTFLILSAALAATMMYVFVLTPARGQTRQGDLRKTQTRAELEGQVSMVSIVPLEFVVRVDGADEATVVVDQDTVLVLGADSGLQHTIGVAELRVGDKVTVSGTRLADGRVLARMVKVAVRTAQVSRASTIRS